MTYSFQLIIRRLHQGLLVCGAITLAGCAHFNTNKGLYSSFEKELRTGDYATVLARVEAAKDKTYKRKDRVVYYLDAGMLCHWNGEYQRSNELLEKAERAIEENFTKSLSRTTSALLLNDNIQAYEGEDYEDIYLNAFKALNYLALNQPDEAFVEVRRINNKLLQLEGKQRKSADKMNLAQEAVEAFKPGKCSFVDSALGRYLSLLLYRNERKWDDVRIDLEKIEQGWKIQPSIYSFKKPAFSNEFRRITSSLARLNIMAFSGVAPDKVASTFYIHTEEDLIILGSSQENYLGQQDLSGLNMIPWPGIEAGYHFKFQLPRMKKRGSTVGRIDLVLEDGTSHTLQRLESLENAAIETFNIKKPMLYLRSLTRSVIKGIASENAKEKMTKDMGEGLAFFARILTDVAVDTTENADLRSSRFFPAEASIMELHLPEGLHSFKINYYSHSGTLLHSDNKTEIMIRGDQINLIESAYLN